MKSFNFNAVGERRNSLGEARTRDLALQVRDLWLHLQATLRVFVFAGISAPWYSGQVVGSLRDLEAAAFLVAWFAPD